MDAEKIIKLYSKFISEYYMEELASITLKGDKHIVVDFNDIIAFSPEIAENLIEDTDESFKAASIGIEQISSVQNPANIKVRIKNLPKSQKVEIRDLRSMHLNKFLCIEGVVRQKSDVRPQAISCRFECPSCGAIIPVLQLDTKFKEPSQCGCGRKGKFKMLSKELIDVQRIRFEESLESLDGGQQPKRIDALLKDDLVSPLSDNKTHPGTKLLLNGILKEIPIVTRTGKQTTRFDFIFEVNYIQTLDEEFGEVKISPEEEQLIINLSKTKGIKKSLIESIAPSIYGHEKIKEALLLQLMGGVRKKREDSSISRGDMHILLIGDPGAGKSQLLKRIDIIAPKSRFVSGKGASAAGLTASVVKDDFLGGWALEAGALVLANKGMLCLDELDKISKEDTSAMHEALEGQKVTISKANIQATLPCETTVLAAANPKFGRFDPYAKSIAQQIELPSTLINRFDMIFPIKDIPKPDVDEQTALFVVGLHKGVKKTEGKIKTEFLRKYIAYCRKINPQITDEAEKVYVNYYTQMRSKGNQETGIKAIPISIRQLEGIIRLSEAYAKIELSDKVTKKHAKEAVNIMDFWLRQVALDEETGEVDIDKIGTGTPSSERSRISAIKRIIAELERQYGQNIPIEEIVKKAEDQEIKEADVDETLKKLRSAGDIFESRKGFIHRI